MEPLRQERVPSEETNVLLLPHTVFNTAKIYSLSCDRAQYTVIVNRTQREKVFLGHFR